MYVSPNFKTKKSLKEAVKLRQEWEQYEKAKKTQPVFTVGAALCAKYDNKISTPRRVTVFSPGPFPCPENGWVTVEGPHYPEAHKWYANVYVENAQVTKVK